MKNRKFTYRPKNIGWWALLILFTNVAELSIHPTVKIAKKPTSLLFFSVFFCIFFIYSAVFLEAVFCVAAIVGFVPFLSVSPSLSLSHALSLSNVFIYVSIFLTIDRIFGVFFCDVTELFFSAVFAQPYTYRMLSSAINELVFVVVFFLFFSDSKQMANERKTIGKNRTLCRNWNQIKILSSFCTDWIRRFMCVFCLFCMMSYRVHTGG